MKYFFKGPRDKNYSGWRMLGSKTRRVTLLLEVVQGVGILLTDHIDVRLDDDGVCRCLQKARSSVSCDLPMKRRIPDAALFAF